MNRFEPYHAVVRLNNRQKLAGRVESSPHPYFLTIKEPGGTTHEVPLRSVFQITRCTPEYAEAEAFRRSVRGGPTRDGERRIEYDEGYEHAT